MRPLRCSRQVEVRELAGDLLGKKMDGKAREGILLRIDGVRIS